MATALGTVIDGKYELLKKIGQGGMSVVYLAMDKRLNKQWAVKEISKQGKDKNGAIYVQSLVTEANLMKRLDHPAVPRIVDIIENSQVIYVVMDYIEGESLDKVLTEFGPQPQDVVIDWAKQLADALNYLHSQNPPIIYRDMKPANIMLKPEGTVKLIDFGTAREYKGTNLADTVVLGTPGFAAPEQYGKRETDARTDIYCLGMTMHNLLTGQDPTSADYEYFPVRHWNPELHEGIERVIERCVRPDPADRFQSCSELLYALENYEQETEAYRRAQKRKVSLFFAAAGLSLAMLVVSLGSYLTAQGIKKSNYEDCIDTPASMSFAQKVEQYSNAVALNPKRLEAYEKLLDAYEDNGSFDRDESNTLAGLFAQYSGDKNSEEYIELCYRIGFMYFNFYTENGNESFQARVVKSAGYFTEINDLLERNPELEFEKRDVAESYYTITRFYKENSSMQLQKAHTQENLNDLVAALKTCVSALDDFDESQDESAQAIKLDQYAHIAEQINELRNEFATVGVSEEHVIDLLDQIETSERTITLAGLAEDREKALADCSAFKENIERAYHE